MRPHRLFVAHCLFLSGLVSTAIAQDEGKALGPGHHALKINAAGHTWHYAVQVPKDYDGTKPVPMVLVLHGAGGGGEAYLKNAGWAKKADEAGFLAVAPDGLPAGPDAEPSFLTNPRLWNSGQLRPLSPRAAIDDKVFFTALLDDVAKRWKLDPDRVYLTGHSNGGGMTFRLGFEMSERFAALAPVASGFWIVPRRSTPKRPLPTLFIIGTEDPLVPLAGGERTLPWGKSYVPPMERTLENWSKAQGCPYEAKVRKDENGVKVVDYGPGTDGVMFTVVYIEGHGHGWPGGKALLNSAMMGPISSKVDATDMIWDFFREKTRAK